MVVTVIGTGLIGGSFALALKDSGLAEKIIGIDHDHNHVQRALELGLIDEAGELIPSITSSQLIILAIPVDNSAALLQEILPFIDRQVVIDVGSTKKNICDLVSESPNRNRFVATHPMWGTEFCGPDAALRGAFKNKAVVICDKEFSDSDALDLTEKIYHKLGMHILYMSPEDHDIHAAYVSHISHISSFALANTVLEKEKEDNAIFEMASAGFESTVRLAKSNVSMWVPIFMENRENILDVLNEHISQLRKFKVSLEKENTAYLAELILNANSIKKIIK